MRTDESFENIEEALAEAYKRDGAIGERRIDFMDKVEKQMGDWWYLAMNAAGNAPHLLFKEVRDDLKKEGLWDQQRFLPYEEMYNALMANR
jgi:hypothetical protein